MSASKVRQIAIAGSFFVISVAVIFFQEADTIREWSNKVYDVLYVLDPFAMYKSWYKTLFGGESLPPLPRRAASPPGWGFIWCPPTRHRDGGLLSLQNVGSSSAWMM